MNQEKKNTGIDTPSEAQDYSGLAVIGAGKPEVEKVNSVDTIIEMLNEYDQMRKDHVRPSDILITLGEKYHIIRKD